MTEQECWTFSNILTDKITEIALLNNQISELKKAFDIWYRGTDTNKEFKSLVEIQRILGIK